jgi:hypothetical protein
MKSFYTLPILLLIAGCMDSPQCMESNDKGTVVRATTDTEKYCGRGGCSQYTYSFITVNVNGVSRTCIVPDSTAAMFAPGEVINLSTGRRL